MDERARAVTWEAPAHNHLEKSGDWFWVLGIISLSVAVAAFFLGNYLFALLVVIAGAIVAMVANRRPKIVEYAVTTRGIRVDDTLYPYSSLDAFYLDEDDPQGPQLLVRSKKMFMPLIICPLPDEHLDVIEDILETRLPEEHIEEPLATKLLEIVGF